MLFLSKEDSARTLPLPSWGPNFPKSLFKICTVAFWKIVCTLKHHEWVLPKSWRVGSQRLLLFFSGFLPCRGFKKGYFPLFQRHCIRVKWLPEHSWHKNYTSFCQLRFHHFKVSFGLKREMEKSHMKRPSVFRLYFLVLVVHGVRSVFLKESQKALWFLHQASVLYQIT